uniref:Uncharacterized protein n=1 Tax=Romanomermis culicivorax TaxID=13658 RepID=A0A915L2N7_ROMCU
MEIGRGQASKMTKKSLVSATTCQTWAFVTLAFIAFKENQIILEKINGICNLFINACENTPTGARDFWLSQLSLAVEKL